MVIVVAIVVVLLLVGGSLWIVRRRTGDETHSVEGYRNTLDTLQGIRSRSSSTSVRVLGGQGEQTAQGEGTGPSAPGEGAHAAPGRLVGSSRTELVFEDPALREGPAGSNSFGGRRTQDRAMSAMNHRPRRLGAPILVGVIVLVLLAVVVVLGARAQHHKTSTTTTTHATKSSTTAAPGAAHSGTTTPTTANSSGKKHSSVTTTTPTTAPTSFAAINSTSTTGTYTPPATAYTVTLTASGGDCWVTVKSSTGASVYSATMLAGQAKSLPMTGASSIILGAPSAVTITMDHEPVVLPTGYQTPFTLTLQPAAT